MKDKKKRWIKASWKYKGQPRCSQEILFSVEHSVADLLEDWDPESSIPPKAVKLVFEDHTVTYTPIKGKKESEDE